uniref:uncharacterized protein LOC122581555 n=1 Tax=Erigeron canadensis TaxID=72917 RepID=UPI001CB9A661|nr:uncharacterized protein LOC122581555 [Erigeron canadensis]
MDVDGTLPAEPLDPLARCCLCCRVLPSEVETVRDIEAINVCADCKYLFLENRRTPQRYSSSLDSIQNMLSQQFRDAISDHGSQSRDWTGSDTESDGFDSVLGEGNIFSYAANVSDSDASVDSLLDNSVPAAHPNARSYVDSETDDDQFEGVEGGESLLGSLGGRIQLHRSLATNGRNLPADWLSEILSDEGIRNIERRRLFGILEEQETLRGDYVDAEADISRRGALPTALLFVKNLQLVAVDKELVCVICKDNACVGTVMNKLPCGHVYHPSCIMPWLNVRNTCPLCRYELPTDYEKERGADEYIFPVAHSASSGVKWWFVAAPLVSVVAMGVVVWLRSGVFDGQRDVRSSGRWWPLL